MRQMCLLFPFLFLFLVQLGAAEVDNASHLKGIRSLYMDVDTSMATDIKASERLDLNDIMELQLRRGSINLESYVLNQPEANIPLVRLSIDTSSRVASGEFELTLRVWDNVAIERNNEKIVAPIFEMRRRGSIPTSSKQIEAIKSELRDLMADFVTAFRKANPRS